MGYQSWSDAGGATKVLPSGDGKMPRRNRQHLLATGEPFSRESTEDFTEDGSDNDGSVCVGLAASTVYRIKLSTRDCAGHSSRALKCGPWSHLLHPCHWYILPCFVTTPLRHRKTLFRRRHLFVT
ncbi:hypothetical protein HPB50_003184 [Hyalomma asiaticum]|uniref:Uncharacterized protein n=1 Tax=Hyalomma asiaticum TaxID=266040 RepID=A0ACB7TBQ1_HYAAI|nr:hypothetical protein HPB50_003184 [Hyalomma asiaticum]